MGVSKYSKNGLEYLRANFTVHGKATVIEGQIALNDNNYIWYEGFRSANVAGEKTYFSANVLVADYFKDIGYLLKYLDANPFKLDSLYQGLFEQITNHIKEYGRIIDEDLHTYLDYFIIAQNFLSFSHGLKFYNKEEGEKLFNETKDICYKYFADYVWISVPDQFLNFKLVKLKDLIEQQDDKDGTTEKLDSSILKELGTSNGKQILWQQHVSTMGRKSEIKCPNCSYQVLTSGGPDGGFNFFTNTYICSYCNSLVDLSTRARNKEGVEKKDPEEIVSGHQCPKCLGDKFVLWDSNSRLCPRCKTKMTGDGSTTIVFWD
jgi:DNA-directed RNA polymerase subunit RPC12/RpoP